MSNSYQGVMGITGWEWQRNVLLFMDQEQLINADLPNSPERPLTDYKTEFMGTVLGNGLIFLGINLQIHICDNQNMNVYHKCPLNSFTHGLDRFLTKKNNVKRKCYLAIKCTMTVKQILKLIFFLERYFWALLSLIPLVCGQEAGLLQWPWKLRKWRQHLD